MSLFNKIKLSSRSCLILNMSAQDVIGVVLDTGSQNTKAGFASEPFPRAVFSTTVARFRRQGLVDGFPLIYCGKEAIQKRGLSHLIWPVKEGLIQDWDEMEKLWHHTFYKELLVPPEEAKIMHALHPLAPRKDKERMTEVLFESFTVNALYLMKSPALVLHASGRTSGLVWEDGFSCSYVAPVFEGFPLKHSTICSPLTGESLTDRLQKLMAETGYSFTTPTERDLLNNIKAEKCYVAPNYDAEIASSACTGENKVSYHLPDGQQILLGEERFRSPELLFQPSLEGMDCPNIVDIIKSSINSCDIDYRSLFYDNIVIAGGSSMFPGLVERLNAELALRLSNSAIKASVDAMSSRQYGAWVGGSILASLSTLKGFWMTRQEYEDEGPDRVKYKFY